MAATSKMPWSSWGFPVLAIFLYGVASVVGGGDVGSASGIGLAFVLTPVLFGTVFAAVHHAEVVAHRTGEPYGTLILTGAVTVIEVAVIASVMLSENSNPALARDTVFAVAMIVCNGLVGICVVVGGLRYGEQGFRTKGAASYLTVLIAMAALTMVLPNYTSASPGPVYSTPQLVFVSIVTAVLYVAFLYIQTVRHRDYFIIFTNEEMTEDGAPISNRTALISLGLLIVSLIAVIMLAKKFTLIVEAAVSWAGAPYAVVGVVIAALILLPEGVAAIRAAKQDELQKSVNLALGSSLATIGLTVPAVAVMSIALNKPLTLGLDARDTVLLTVTILISMLTFGAGRTNILFGVVHLVMFATFVFLTVVP